MCYNDNLMKYLKPFTLAFLTFACIALAYLPSARFSFVSCDDYQYVYENPQVLGGLTASNVTWAITSCGYAYNWHPLAWISLQADATLTKALRGEINNDRLSHVMHAHSLLLHAANGTLLFILLLLLCRPRAQKVDPDWFPLLTAIVALLWAIHPLRTEVVCWASERKELTSVLWMLLSMVFWMVPRKSCYLLSLVSFALALAGKPVAVTLPATLLAFDWLISGKSFRKAFLRIIPFGLLSAGACLLTLAAQVEPVDVGNQYAVWEKLVMSVSAPVIYLRQTLVPVGLSAFYPNRPPIPWPELILGIVLLAAMTWICIRWLKRRESWAALAAFGVAWAYVSLLPMLGLVKVGDQPHSDRYTYWAGCALVSVCWMALCRFLSGREKTAAQVLGVLLILSFVATRDRLPVWRDSFSLYCDAVPKSWDMQPTRSLARELCSRGEAGTVQAEMMLREALTHTDSCDLHAELAIILAHRIEKSAILFNDGPDPAFAEARLEAESALSGKPKLWRAHEALAIIAMKEGKWEEAIGHHERALAEGESVDQINRFIETCKANLAKEKAGK